MDKVAKMDYGQSFRLLWCSKRLHSLQWERSYLLPRSAAEPPLFQWADYFSHGT
jgi:hypothetical protein